MNSRRSKSTSVLGVALILAVILGALWQWVPLSDAKEKLASLPKKGVGFSGEDVPLSDVETRYLKNVNLIKRTYYVGGESFFVTILDGTHHRHIVHDPYYCFKGSGWQIEAEHPLKTKKGVATQLTISRSGERKNALFWFSTGENHFSSPYMYWWKTILRRLTFGLSGDEPILIVVQTQSEDFIAWEEFLGDFYSLSHL